MAIPKQFKGLIEKSAKQYGIRPSMLAALLFQESGFNPNARSPVGALGIGQFMPATAKGYGINPLDPMQAIPASAKYLGRNFKTYGGNVDKTLASYNAGAGAVARYGGVPPFKETQNYVKRIKQLESQFAKEFMGNPQIAKKPTQPSIIPLLQRDLPFSPVLGAIPSVPESATPRIASSPILESPQNTIGSTGDSQMPFPFLPILLGAAMGAGKSAVAGGNPITGALGGAVGGLTGGTGALAANAGPAVASAGTGAKAAGFFSKLMGGLGNANQLVGGLNQLQGLAGGGGQGMPMYGMPMSGAMPNIQLQRPQFMPIQFAMNPQMEMMRRGLG